MKKGFTLVELIGVIIILALIALLAFPPILNSIRKTKTELSDASKEILYNATSLYVSENLNDFPKRNGNTFCVTLNTLSSKEYLPTKVYDSITGEEISQSKEYLPTKVYDSITGEEISQDSLIEIKVENDSYTYNMNNECVEDIYVPPNKPELLDNMVPIKYNGTNWVVASESDKWYDYDAKEWANAVVLNTTKKVGDIVSESEIDLWYVWIPRYKYQLFNANNRGVDPQEIQIKFESGTSSTGTVSCVDNISGTDGTKSSQTCTNAENGEWYTHPAFTLGTEELTGFWVGKFEVSGSTSKITIKPNVKSLRSQTVSSFFTAIQNINTTYNLNGDSHMMKNMEWGAVAYLSHSKYGMTEEVYINNSEDYYTGRSGGNIGESTNTVATQYPSDSTSSDIYYNYGYYTYDGKIVNYDGSIGDYATDRTLGTKASTTGNIYGVYDMSGSAWEHVMGNMVNSSGNFYSNYSGFSTPPDSIYYDSYTYGTSSTTHGRGKLGDATKETLKTFGSYTGGWYSDRADFPSSGEHWFIRGGRNSSGSSVGLFSFTSNRGDDWSHISARAVACVRG